MLFSAALLHQRDRRAGATRRELLLVDPIEGLGPALRAAEHAGARSAAARPAWCRSCATSPTCAAATEEIEENYRRLRVAEADVRAERDRLDLIIDSVADPILVTDAGGQASC